MTLRNLRRQIGAVSIALSTAALAVQPALAAPSVSRGQQDLPIGYEDCLQRARSAFAQNGWSNIGGGPPASFVLAFKGPNSSYITCNPGPNGIMTINVFVASDSQDGNVPGGERVSLQNSIAGGGVVQSGGLRIEALGAGRIRVHWAGKPGNPQDWVTVVPAGTPTGTPGSYQWANRPAGALDFGPLTPGPYEARFYLNNTYTVQDSLPFNVTGASAGLNVEKLGGGRVRIHWGGKPGGAQDWITVVPIGTPVGSPGAYQWAASASGAVDYGPLAAGTYQARFYYNNTYDLQDSVTFSVP